ncbi:cadherin domain-containing protein [Rhizobium sp. TRM95796]|uniref:cadherin domain-containing protein n=1 Tax=Rhizobium sp. TRM95796 TaxID=2979862 RepID=UPI0021E99FF6|nr:cadherin domain-containing protein [Rhizobium sp. TRM95796]MCV3765072.1 cadherin domain-containing protein [Rhizobium sp. TRM95796]
MAVKRGSKGDDTLFGTTASDRFFASKGQDRLYGGAGTDTLVLTGAAKHYELALTKDNGLVTGSVIDLRKGAPDGVQIIDSIETIKFADDTLEVLGANLPPHSITLSSLSINENVTKNIPYITVSAQDPEDMPIIRYSLLTENTPFKLAQDPLRTASLYVSGKLDYEKQSSYEIVIQAKDLAGGVSTQTFTIEVRDVAERLLGTNANDVLVGDSSMNIIHGMAGNDRMSGGNGDDQLIGGIGKDRLTGGNGDDDFIFKSLADSTANASGRDVITDFARARYEHINLGALDADTSRRGNQDFDFIGSDGFSKTAGELRFTDSKNGVTVQADVDGDGKAEFSIDVLSISKLDAGDFFL